jgi:hypothetical protein
MVDLPTPAWPMIKSAGSEPFARHSSISWKSHCRPVKPLSFATRKGVKSQGLGSSPQLRSRVSPRGAVCSAWRFASNSALPSPSRMYSEELCGPPAASLFSTEDRFALALRRSRCQPSNRTGTNPRRSTSRTTFMIQLGSSRLGNTIADTWRIIHALTM